MAGEKTGDNKMFQLVTLLITSIVAPITVYFATSTINKVNNPPPTPVPTVVQAAVIENTQEQPGSGNPLQATFTFTPELAPDLAPTLVVPTITETITATAAPSATAAPPPTATATNVPTNTAAAPPTATSYGIQNPSGVIPSSSPAVVNNLALSVEPKDITIDGRYVMVNLRVRNLGKESQTFLYRAGSVTIRDSQGKVLEPFYGDKKPQCKSSNLNDQKEIQINSNKEVKVHSVTMKDVGKWCDHKSTDLLPIYAGPVSENAEALLIEFAGFGPFSDFTIEVKLK